MGHGATKGNGLLAPESCTCLCDDSTVDVVLMHLDNLTRNMT